MTLAIFESALTDFKASLPGFWAVEQGEAAIVLTALAEALDGLAEATEGIYADMSLATARQDALLAEWAVLYGASSEQLPPTVDQLRGYLQERAGEDGTVESLEAALLALLADPANGVNPGPTGLRFPIDGSGLEFPADATGITFPSGGWLEVHDHPDDYTLTVLVLTSLTFDRAAFARAVERHRPAHYLPPTITEVSSL